MSNTMRTIMAAAAVAAASMACEGVRSGPAEPRSSEAGEVRPAVQPRSTPANAANGPAKPVNPASIGTPEALIKELYRVHEADVRDEDPRDRILGGKSRTYLDKYFEKRLADFMWNDLTTHQDGLGVADFDIFYNSQDPMIRNLVVHPATVRGDEATLRVTFTNDGATETILYVLVSEVGKWKIRDIKYRNGESLLQIFSEAPQ